MDSIHICGEVPLQGETVVQGSKNAALPILAAALLVPGISVIHNCPRIADVFLMIKLLQSVGCTVSWEGHTVLVDASRITDCTMPPEYVVQMRSSIVFMGAMLGRVGETAQRYPGGCVIGKRPVDLHLKAMKQMGVETSENEEGFQAKAKHLHGAKIVFPFPSVGATENTILAAVLAEGDTIIEGAAKEPEIMSLCEFLNCAGAKIAGAGGERIVIEGVASLRACEYRVPSDRIVAGTYLLACMSAGGEIYLDGAPAEQLAVPLKVLEKMGAAVHCGRDGIFLAAPESCRGIGYLRTQVYPGFPTDLQSPLLAVLASADGESVVEETIFENRYRVVMELNRMGAGITVAGSKAFVKGGASLRGDHVVAKELRGGAALVVAGLGAKGITMVADSRFIDRGYENICRDLRALGAKISYEEKKQG